MDPPRTVLHGRRGRIPGGSTVGSSSLRQTVGSSSLRQVGLLCLGGELGAELVDDFAEAIFVPRFARLTRIFEEAFVGDGGQKLFEERRPYDFFFDAPTDAGVDGGRARRHQLFHTERHVVQPSHGIIPELSHRIPRVLVLVVVFVVFRVQMQRSRRPRQRLHRFPQLPRVGKDGAHRRVLLVLVRALQRLRGRGEVGVAQRHSGRETDHVFVVSQVVRIRVARVRGERRQRGAGRMAGGRGEG